MSDEPTVEARIVIEDGKLKVYCGRRSAEGTRSCAGKFGTLVVWPDGGGTVQLEPHGRWHRDDDGVLYRTRRRRRTVVPTRGAGGLIERTSRLASVPHLFQPELCRCPVCKKPPTINRVDPDALAAEYRHKPERI